MSGWLLLVAILAVAALGWSIYTSWRTARGVGPAVRGRTGRRGREATRRFDVARPVSDTEFSAESFVPPEESRGGGQPDQEAEFRTDRSRKEPWGKVAVPGWEHPLPWSYDETRAVALVRDPYWVFTYWEINGEAHRAAEEVVGKEAWFSARPVARVHDSTTGGYYDVAIDEQARNWYFNVGQPDRTWYVEIGRITENGRFVMLARSNSVHTPRDCPSTVIDPSWPPLGYARLGFWPEGMPCSPGMGMPASPGMMKRDIDATMEMDMGMDMGAGTAMGGEMAHDGMKLGTGEGGSPE